MSFRLDSLHRKRRGDGGQRSQRREERRDTVRDEGVPPGGVEDCC